MSHEQYQTIIQALHECMSTCNYCYDMCLKEDDIQMMSDCIRLDRECADFCAYFEQALTRNTPFATELAKACVSICEECGNECNKHSHQHCKDCADACLKCAEACKKFIS